MMKRIDVHPQSQVEIRTSILRYRDQSKPAAIGFSYELKGAFLAIRKHPRLYSTYLLGTQRRILDRYPFSVVYRELLDQIQIIAVAHHKRHPGYQKTEFRSPEPSSDRQALDP